jgi:hypothetical protein
MPRVCGIDAEALRQRVAQRPRWRNKCRPMPSRSFEPCTLIGNYAWGKDSCSVDLRPLMGQENSHSSYSEFASHSALALWSCLVGHTQLLSRTHSRSRRRGRHGRDRWSAASRRRRSKTRAIGRRSRESSGSVDENPGEPPQTVAIDPTMRERRSVREQPVQDCSTVGRSSTSSTVARDGGSLKRAMVPGQRPLGRRLMQAGRPANRPQP